MERKAYSKLVWVNRQTKLSAANMNHIEEGVEYNNLLAQENANFIDEIFAALIEQLYVGYDQGTHTFTLSIGSSVGDNPTTRFNVAKNVEIHTVDQELNALISALNSGSTVVSKAYKDQDGNNIKSTYGASLELSTSFDATTGSFVLSLKNKNDETLAEKTFALNSASVAQAGLMSGADKNKVDNIATDIATALASAKTYTDSKVARTNLVSVLGEASTTLNGIMSAEDKRRLNVLYNVLGENGDADAFVNNINEIISIFSQYPEGTTIVTALAGKLDKSDVLNTLDSDETGKALSAAKGKQLKEEIDELENKKANAADVYDKTYIDEAIAGFVFADIDDELDEESDNAIKNKTVAKAFKSKHPSLTAGLAEGIASDREIEDADVSCPPISFGITGGDAEIQTGNNKFERLEGKSIKWNQLSKNTMNVYSGNVRTTLINSATKEYLFEFRDAYDRDWLLTTPVTDTIKQGHKYLITILLKENTSNSHSYWFVVNQQIGNSFSIPNDNNYHRYSAIFQSNSTYIPNYNCIKLSESNKQTYADGDTISAKCWQLFDLTEIFGEGNEPATFEEFKAIFPLDYYEYNAGSILSSKSASLISRGKNQFSDLNTFIRVVTGQEYELSGISAGSLVEYDVNKNEIETHSIVGRTVLTMSDTTHYVKITATSYEDIMFYLTFPEDGGVYNEPFEEYREQVVELPNIELRSVGDIRDVAYSSGGGKRRIEYVNIIDMINAQCRLTDSANGSGKQIIFDSGYGYLLTHPVKAVSAITKGNILTTLYETVSNNTSYNQAYSGTTRTMDNFVSIGSTGFINIVSHDFDNLSTKQDLIDYFTSHPCYIQYELATEEDIPLSENPGWTELVHTDNFGTIEFTTSPVQILQVEQPYFIRYTVSLVEFVDTAYVHCEGDGNNIATEKEAEAFRKGTDVVGLARASESLTPYSEESGATDATPFVFQTAGGDADISNKVYLKALRGNTIKWKQEFGKFNSGTHSSSGFAWTASEDGKSVTLSGTTTASSNTGVSLNPINIIRYHKYFVGCKVSGTVSEANQLAIKLCGQWQWQQFKPFAEQVSINDKYFSQIFSANGDGTLDAGVRVSYDSGITYNVTITDCIRVDLTELFGAGNEPTTVAEFKRMFPKPYYEYNPGKLLSSKVNGIKNVWYNAFDGELEVGYIGNHGNFIQSTGNCRTNYIKVIAGQTYTFGNENFTVANGRRVCEYDINKNFIKATVNWGTTSDTITLSNNTQYVAISYNGTSKQTNAQLCIHLTWDNSRTGFEQHKSKTYPLPNIELRSNPNTGTYDEIKPDGTYIQRVGIRAYQSGDESDTSVFTDKTNTIYDLQTPIETKDDAYKYQEIQDIDDFGTQEYLYDDDIDIPVPQGAEFFYPVDYKAFIDSVGGREDIGYDAGEIVSHNELQTALANFLSSISGYDATKSQTLKNNQGTFTWVDDE